jgi:hypothetical protein
MGSPLYMAPEQCQELSTVTDRADVYSLGIILYELLAGRTPFVSEVPAELMVMHVRQTPPPLQEVAGEVAEPVVALVHAMLAKEPSARPSMHKVADRLGQLHLAQPGGRPQTQVLWRRRWPLQAGLVALALLGVAAGAVGIARWRRPPVAPMAPVPAAAPAPSVAPSPTPPPAPAAAPQTVDWAISTAPAGAAVLDEATGTRLGVTPLQLTRPKQHGRQTVVLRLAGYRDVTLALDGERDFSVERQLTPLPPPAGRPPRKRNKDDLIAPSL